MVKKWSKRCLVILTVLFCGWLWLVTTPETEVGEPEAKVGPGYRSVYRTNLWGYTYDLGYITYKLCLVDVYGQNIDIHVSRDQFNKAKFGEHGPWEVARIIRHYEFTWWKTK